MDYNKFAKDIDAKIAAEKAERSALEERLEKARATAAGVDERLEEATRTGDEHAYFTAKADGVKAAEAAEMYEKQLAARPPKTFSYNEYETAKEKLAGSYNQEVDEIDKIMRRELQNLAKRLDPLAAALEEHRRTGDAALERMRRETNANEYGLEPPFTGAIFNRNAAALKLLKVIDELLAGSDYVGVKF